jgi:tRNA U34 5-methylaminomethyl-2-thiouridine-forming methyltransferase MnmC
MLEEWEVTLTDDGSHTVVSKLYKAEFHSTHGAIQESLHVFIQNGLNSSELNSCKALRILELGFGTGLNALLTLNKRGDRKIYYHTIEKHPLPFSLVEKLNYLNDLKYSSLTKAFHLMHQSSYEQEIQISENFKLFKQSGDFEELALINTIDLIYHDAFAPSVDEKYWSEPFVRKLYHALHPGGVLVTYCAKGSFKRALRAAGFQVETLPGPPGKREMTKAIKPN